MISNKLLNASRSMRSSRCIGPTKQCIQTRHFSNTKSSTLSSKPYDQSDEHVSPASVSISPDPHPKGVTSTTASLWEMRRTVTDSVDQQFSQGNRRSAVPTISNESEVHPRHPRFASMDVQLSSALEALSNNQKASHRPYLLPSDSRLCMILPMKSDPHFHDEYVRFDGGVRFGMILEDLDAFAANISHFHVLLGSQLSEKYLPPQSIRLVTASVESIVLKRKFPMDRDIVMRGNVVHVGRSSMEVWIELVAIEPKSADSQNNKSDSTDYNMAYNPEHFNEKPILDAYFSMVARDSTTGAAASVCPFNLDAMEGADRVRYRQGTERKERRQNESARSLVKKPPTENEIQLLHQFLMNDPSQHVDPLQGVQTGNAIIHPKIIPMSSTIITSLNMTQPQERNTNGKIFGGSLMRKAYELARTCAYLFAGAHSQPYLVASDTITFLRPVEVGSVVEFQAQVFYSAGTPSKLFQINVQTRIRDLINETEFMSNAFNFTFRSDSTPLRKVQPLTYREAMSWLDGRRLIEKHVAVHSNLVTPESYIP